MQAFEPRDESVRACAAERVGAQIDVVAPLASQLGCCAREHRRVVRVEARVAPVDGRAQTVARRAGRLASWDSWEAALISVLRGEPEPPPGASSASLESAADGGDVAADELKQAVSQLADFSHLLPPDYRKDYAAWRTGSAKGAKGELEEVMESFEAMQDSVMNNTSEDFTEIHVYRRSYASWRRGKARGAKGNIVELTKQHSAFL